MSTTTDRNVAMHYASGGTGGSLVFEVQANRHGSAPYWWWGKPHGASRAPRVHPACTPCVFPPSQMGMVDRGASLDWLSQCAPTEFGAHVSPSCDPSGTPHQRQSIYCYCNQYAVTVAACLRLVTRPAHLTSDPSPAGGTPRSTKSSPAGMLAEWNGRGSRNINSAM